LPGYVQPDRFRNVLMFVHERKYEQTEKRN
jgi:thioredoxin-related protein